MRSSAPGGPSNAQDASPAVRTKSYLPSVVAALTESSRNSIMSFGENPPVRRYASVARKTASCSEATQPSVSIPPSMPISTADGSVESTTQMHLSPARRPASKKGRRSSSRSWRPKKKPQK